VRTTGFSDVLLFERDIELEGLWSLVVLFENRVASRGVPALRLVNGGLFEGVEILAGDIARGIEKSGPGGTASGNREDEGIGEQSSGLTIPAELIPGAAADIDDSSVAEEECDEGRFISRSGHGGCGDVDGDRGDIAGVGDENGQFCSVGGEFFHEGFAVKISAGNLEEVTARGIVRILLGRIVCAVAGVVAEDGVTRIDLE